MYPERESASKLTKSMNTEQVVDAADYTVATGNGREDGISDEAQRDDKARMTEMINACNSYPEPGRNRGVFEFALRSKNDGEATTFISETVDFSDVHCCLVRTMTQEQVIQQIQSYDFAGMLAQVHERMAELHTYIHTYR
jgi:hypothetical protein